MYVRCKGIFQHCMKLQYSYYYTKNNALNFLDLKKKHLKVKILEACLINNPLFIAHVRTNPKSVLFLIML